MSRFTADDIAALDSAWGRRSIENPSTSITAATLEDLFGAGYGETPAGTKVNATTAMHFWLVFACVRVIAETMAVLPLHVYRRTSKQPEIAPDHRLYNMLRHKPSRLLTAYAFREAEIAQAIIYGRSHAMWMGESLLLVPPNLRVDRRVTNGRVVWRIQYPDGHEDVPDAQMINVNGLTLDGFSGISVPLKAARDIVGEAMAVQEHSSRFFSNGARPGGILSTDLPLKDEAIARIRQQWQLVQGGLANAYRTAVLEQGMKFQALAVQSDHAQLVETRKILTEQITGAFRVPPMFIGDYSRMTYSNSEQNDLHFSKHCITPWVVKVEQELNSKLFANDPEHFCKFNLRGLLRGDFKSQIETLSKGVQSGLYTPNEARELLDLPEKEGGDKLFIQQNMVSVDALENQPIDQGNQNGAAGSVSDSSKE